MTMTTTTSLEVTEEDQGLLEALWFAARKNFTEYGALSPMCFFVCGLETSIQGDVCPAGSIVPIMMAVNSQEEKDHTSLVLKTAANKLAATFAVIAMEVWHTPYNPTTKVWGERKEAVTLHIYKRSLDSAEVVSWSATSLIERSVDGSPNIQETLPKLESYTATGRFVPF
jgi:hypothetical protein